MQSNNDSRVTLFQDDIEDVFLKPFPSDGSLCEKKVQLVGYFSVLSSSKQQKYYRYYFELRGSLVYCYQKPGDRPIAFMDVAGAFVKSTSGTMVNGEPNFGVKLIKRKTYEELFTPVAKDADGWFAVLKKYCILTKFKLYFETVQVLGRGNFAKVFLVRRVTDQKEFAVKVFSKRDVTSSPTEKKCLLYEIKMMRKMNHHRLIRLYEIYEGENFIYCLCELYTGPSLLDAIIKKGSQPEEKALSIILQILEALAYIHSKSIIHRDLKPENIILRTANEQIDIVIVDLGFATYEQDYKNLFTRCGTPGYVAPEVLNDKSYDCRADIYAAGIIFYLMLTHKLDRHRALQRQVVQRYSHEKHARNHQH